MRNLIVFCLLLGSISLFASENKSVVFPQLTVWPNGVDVRVWNTTNRDIRCSGTINIRTRSGQFRTEFYNSIVYRGMTDWRHFNNWRPQDPYLTAFHSINCFAY